MSIETRIDPENPNVATFHFSDGYWSAHTTIVVRGLDLPDGLAPRVVIGMRSRRGTTPSSTKTLEITWAIQGAIDAFLG